MPACGLKIVIIFLLFSAPPVKAAPEEAARSLHEIFPDLTLDQIQTVFSDTGLKNTFTRNESPLFTPASDSEIDLLGVVMEKEPSQLIEALVMVPYDGRVFTRLDAYNALGRIENISDHLVFSTSRGNRYIPLIEQSTRLENGNRNRPIPDPPPATVLPSSETVYLHLKDTFFGSTYFRANFSLNRHGLTYHMTNNAAIRFFIFPVMRVEQFVAIIHVEPLAEGMLIYGVGGITIPEFLVNRLNLASQIDRRVTVLLQWLKDGMQ